MKVNNELKKEFPSEYPFGDIFFDLDFITDNNGKLRYIIGLYQRGEVDSDNEIYGTMIFDATSIIEDDGIYSINCQEFPYEYINQNQFEEKIKNFWSNNNYYIFDDTIETIKKLI